MRSAVGLVANENIIVAPPRIACCYNICLPVDSAVIRATQRPALLSSHKGEQESRKLSRRYTHARTHARVRRVSKGREGERKIEKDGERRRSVTIIMHSCPKPGSPMSKYIYCPPPLACFLRWLRCVSHHCRPFIRLLPTCTSPKASQPSRTTITDPFNELKQRRTVALRFLHPHPSGILELGTAISTIAQYQWLVD